MDLFDTETFENEKSEDPSSCLTSETLTDNQLAAHNDPDKGQGSLDPPPSTSYCENLLVSKEQSLLFDLDEDENASLSSTSAQAGSSTLENLQKLSEDGAPSNTSLFDDLLDFSSSTKDNLQLQNELTDSKPVSNVDLLLGVDDDRILPRDLSPVTVMVRNPDILDFVDVPFDLPEVSSMDASESLTSESFSNDWDLIHDMSPVKASKEQSPDIMITTTASLDSDLDTTDSRNEKKTKKIDEGIREKIDEGFKEKIDEGIKEKIDEGIKEKIDEGIKEKSSEETDSNRGSASSQDLDFSVLMLPEGAHLNFDHVKHKRNLSQKGSIANRKRPKRATIQPNSEDSIFIDSTEPKSQNHETEDEQDSISNSDLSREEKPQDNDSKLSDELSPSRKFTGGIKIPGLLEGLSKTKTFIKSEKKSPDLKQSKSPELTSPTSGSGAERSQTATSPTARTLTTAESPPAIRPKPVVLPRVLPPAMTKSLKESQNQNAAGEGVVRASSFRNTSAPIKFEPASLTSTPLSRSASVKVPGVLANREVQPSLLREPKGGSDLLPSKPELKKRPDPVAPKPSARSPPPPVAAKPTVAARPGGSNLRVSASFSGGRSPLLPTSSSTDRAESSNIVQQKSDSSVPLKTEKNSEPNSANTTEQKPLSRLHQNINSKPFISDFTAGSKASLPQKNMDIHSTPPYSQKTSPEVETGKPHLRDSENHKTGLGLGNSENHKTELGLGDSGKHKTELDQTLSPKKSEPAGVVLRTEFKPEEKHAAVERKKSDSFDASDVFNSSSDTISSSVLDSSSSDSRLKNTETGYEITPPRKSSFSGITPVRSPLVGEKAPSGGQPRKGSISSSAYNPIGFRSALGSTDGESKSRGSSFTGSVDGGESLSSIVSSSFTSTDTSPKQHSRELSAGSEEKKSKDGSFSGQVNVQLRHSPVKSVESSPGRTDLSIQVLTGTSSTLGSASKRSEEKQKEVTEESNKDVQLRSRAVRESKSPSTQNGSQDSSKVGVAGDRRSSPWNVQLKKVDRKEPSAKPELSSKEESQPLNWRQQLTGRPRSTFIPENSDKAKQDNTPDWAKASIMRRQRLIDSGVIKGDSKKTDVF